MITEATFLTWNRTTRDKHRKTRTAHATLPKEGRKECLEPADHSVFQETEQKENRLASLNTQLTGKRRDKKTDGTRLTAQNTLTAVSRVGYVTATFDQSETRTQHTSATHTRA